MEKLLHSCSDLCSLQRLVHAVLNNELSTVSYKNGQDRDCPAVIIYGGIAGPRDYEKKCYAIRRFDHATRYGDPG